MRRYIDRIVFVAYYFFCGKKYRFLSFKANVYASVKVNGKKYISIHRNSIVQRYGWLLAMKNEQSDPVLLIEEGCAIGDFSHITCVRSVIIRKHVLIANNVYISDNQHGFSDINIPIRYQPVKFTTEIELGSGCWIGENACIMASVGKNSVVAANSVVTKPIPDYCVAAGIPAKVIKRYNCDTQSWEKVI